MIMPILYVFKFDKDNINTDIDLAIKRLNCSLKSLYRQSDIIYILNASEIDIKNKLIIDSDKLVYIHKSYNNKIFNKPLLINFMVKHFLKNYEYFIFSDIDLVYDNCYVSYMKFLIDENKTKGSGKNIRVVPYNINMIVEHYSFDYRELDDIMNQDARIKPQGWSHGNGLIHVPTFMKIRGYNQNYLQYGPEDQEFNYHISKFNDIIYKQDIKDIHIWHLPAPRDHLKDNLKMFENNKKEIDKNINVVFNDEKWGDY